MEIAFHAEDIALPELDQQKLIRWLVSVAESEERSIGELNYIFCSSEYLLEINRTYLRHDYHTDIITFDYSEDEVSGDIFISIPMVKSNAEEFGESFDREIHRVMAHGLLHLLGYRDKSDAEIMEMREKEEAALSLR